MLTIQNLNTCSGCGACYNACSSHAISMQYDTEGFLYPIIKKEKCTDCKKCERVCPFYGNSFLPETNDPECYAAIANDKERLPSSSGGAFSVFAGDFLENGGFVCGAAFDSENLVQHIVIDSIDDLDKLRRSKYVQSDTKTVYTQIKKLLDIEKFVLFCGTPCQVAGLYGFLGHDYSNLLTIDLICHGVPSPMVWKKYVHEVFKNSKIASINFRDKSGNASWKDFFLTIVDEFGNILSESHKENLYVRGFSKNLYLRKSCTACPFAKTPRKSDVTIGDYWDIENFHENFTTDNLGVSAILTNTSKGKVFFNKVKDKFKNAEDCSLEQIFKKNGRLISSPKPHKNSSAFFSDFAKLKDSEKITPILEKHLGIYDVAILNFAYVEWNYGAILGPFALQTVVERLGYNPKIVYYCPPDAVFRSTNTEIPSRDFKNRFFNMTGICTSKRYLQQNILPNFDRYIVGSDTVFDIMYYRDYIYLLGWLYGKKSMISYAASFNGLEINDNEPVEYVKKKLTRFDALSVREKSGIKVLKELGLKSSWHIDPTLLLAAKDYSKIINNDKSDVPSGDYIACYFINGFSIELSNELKHKYKIVNILKDESENYRPIGQWLNLIRNAKYVITNSFHGSVFSIIFKKEFITIRKSPNERISNLFNELEIEKSRYLIKDSLPITESLFARPIDWLLVYKKIKMFQKIAIDYLRESLKLPLTDKAKLKGPIVRILDLDKLRSLPHKDLYLWGTGEDSLDVESECKHKGLTISAFLDSYKTKQGVLDPTSVIQKPRGTFYILIATSKYADEIAKTLREAGLVEREDFQIPFFKPKGT